MKEDLALGRLSRNQTHNQLQAPFPLKVIDEE